MRLYFCFGSKSSPRCTRASVRYNAGQGLTHVHLQKAAMTLRTDSRDQVPQNLRTTPMILRGDCGHVHGWVVRGFKDKDLMRMRSLQTLILFLCPSYLQSSTSSRTPT